MKHQIISKKTPEEEELEKKRIDLAALESELAERELDLATLEAELGAFELQYLKTVGLRLAELDRIEAEIAEVLAAQSPQDSAARQRVEQARARAKDSEKETDSAKTAQVPKFEPTEDLKKLYHSAAKKFHPDLATDDEERQRRTRIMADINKAYSEGNGERLRAILEETEPEPEYVKGESIGAELVRVIRKIAQVRQRLIAIADGIAKLKGSDLFALMMKAKDGEEQGIDLLAEMAATTDRSISEARNRLGRLRKAKKAEEEKENRRRTSPNPQQSSSA
jgi:hypothetical protein